jgi:hypothetical protein
MLTLLPRCRYDSALRFAFEDRAQEGGLEVLPMRIWVKAFGLFAIMVATPFVIERLLGRNPRLPGAREVGGWPWGDYLTYGAYGAVSLVVLAAIVGAFIYYYKAEEISELLTLAERELNNQLRGWGGGLSADTRKGWAAERGSWLQMIKDEKTEVAKTFFELNQSDLASGGPQGGAMGKARMTAFILREIYEGNVETAQLKVHHEVKAGSKPFIAPGLSKILGYEKYKDPDGFPDDAGIEPNLLWFAVKIFGHPRNIIMVKTVDGVKVAVRNWEVLEELTTPKL